MQLAIEWVKYVLYINLLWILLICLILNPDHLRIYTKKKILQIGKGETQNLDYSDPTNFSSPCKPSWNIF